MKVYRIEIVIEEGNDEFWDGITKDGRTGVDDVLDEVRNALDAHGFNLTNSMIKVKEFKDQETPKRFNLEI